MTWPFVRRTPQIIGSGKPSAFYAGCLRDPVTGERGPEIWLPWLDPILICGRNRSGKDRGIIQVNALMREGKISQVFQDTRFEAPAISLPYRRTKGPALVANLFDMLADRPG